MIAAMIAMTLSAAPVVIQIDLQDALRFPSGVESPPANPLQIFVKAPASWLTAKGISEAGKKEVLARLYGDPNWMNGNSDGSTYVVKSFASKVIAAAPENPKAYWYEVNASGVIEKKGPSFGEPIAPKAPTSLIDQAEKGSVFKTGPAVAKSKELLEWLGSHSGLIKLPVVLTKSSMGFSNRSAKVGSTGIVIDDATLGVSLADRAGQLCGSGPCELWLLGTWKGKSGQDLVFQVTKVDRAISSVERELKLNEHVMYQAG
jgi:hypothetical protein